MNSNEAPIDVPRVSRAQHQERFWNLWAIAPAAALVVLVACGPPAGTAPERAGATVTARYTLEAAELGSVDGAVIRDGGYSALAFDDAGALWTVTDRGPNLEAENRLGRPAKRFPIPGYRPVAERLDAAEGTLRVVERVVFGTPDQGRVASGLPPPARAEAITVEAGLGRDFAELPHDPEGIDSEGLAFDGRGGMWVGDEYRPSIWHLDAATGALIRRYTPTPRGLLDAPLPEYLLQRQPNLGIEGIALGPEGYLYASLQGPLSPPGGDDFTAITRILRLDTASGEVRAFAYAMEASTRKLGDLALAPDGRLLVLEHGERSGIGGWSAEVYAIDLDRVDYLDPRALPPERFRDVTTALTQGVVIAPKELYVDLLAAGWPRRYQKPEGLAVDSEGRLLLVNDNDFGLDSPMGTGAAVATGVGTELLVIE